MSTRESRPQGAAPESPAKATTSIVAELDDLHRAWIVGWDHGYAVGRQHASEEMARALLHEQAAVMAGVAVGTAAAHHGSGWASLIRQQSEVDG